MLDRYLSEGFDQKPSHPCGLLIEYDNVMNLAVF